MSELVAERRPDKNGVMVTRWVKPAQGTSGSKPIPAPKSNAAPTDKALKTLNDFLSGYDCDFPPYSDSLRVNVTRMGDYADEFADGVELLFGASDLVISLSEVADRIYGDDSEVPKEHRNTVMKNYVSIVPPYNEEEERVEYGTYAAYFAKIVFEGVGGYSATREYTEDQKIAYKAAALYTEAVFPRPDDGESEERGFITTDGKVRFADRKGLDALADYPLLADAIAYELSLRKVFSEEHVRSMANTGTLLRGFL